MKKSNEVKYLICYEDSTGKVLGTATRKSAEACSKWANKMFSKYGEQITVEQFNAGMVTECRWHA